MDIPYEKLYISIDYVNVNICTIISAELVAKYRLLGYLVSDPCNTDKFSSISIISRSQDQPSQVLGIFIYEDSKKVHDYELRCSTDDPNMINNICMAINGLL